MCIQTQLWGSFLLLFSKAFLYHVIATSWVVYVCAINKALEAFTKRSLKKPLKEQENNVMEKKALRKQNLFVVVLVYFCCCLIFFP